jgi:hypothetical protein
MFNQPFYSIIRPSDRGVVRQYIEAAKEMSPVKNDDRRPGGYLYARFHVLKVSRRVDVSCSGAAPWAERQSGRAAEHLFIFPTSGLIVLLLHPCALCPVSLFMFLSNRMVPPPLLRLTHLS